MLVREHELGPFHVAPAAAGAASQVELLGGALRQFETLYLRQVNSRLQDSAGRAATASLTMSADSEKARDSNKAAAAAAAADAAVAGANLLTESIATELRAAFAHAPLQFGVAVACAKALRTFISKTEELFDSTAESTALSVHQPGNFPRQSAVAAPTAAQRRNAALCRALEAVRFRICEMAGPATERYGGLVTTADVGEPLLQRARELEALATSRLSSLGRAVESALLSLVAPAILSTR
ncbi:hypothetical protein T492DRAFT_81358 [Pavlovales sp. CCMP2436]|nr:hypothetical protein T492DRAFT_81358 [Pavlovales sp. CCMP2436]